MGLLGGWGESFSTALPRAATKAAELRLLVNLNILHRPGVEGCPLVEGSRSAPRRAAW